MILNGNEASCSIINSHEPMHCTLEQVGPVVTSVPVRVAGIVGESGVDLLIGMLQGDRASNTHG